MRLSTGTIREQTDVHSHGGDQQSVPRKTKSYAELCEQVLALGPAHPTGHGYSRMARETAFGLAQPSYPSSPDTCCHRPSAPFGILSSSLQAHRQPTLSLVPLMRTGAAHLATRGSARVLNADPRSASVLISQSSGKQQNKPQRARTLSEWVLARVRRAPPQGCGTTSGAHSIEL